MEILLFLLFVAACFMLFIALFIYPRIKSLDNQVNKTYSVIPHNTPLSQIAPEIGYVFPEFTPLPVPVQKFRYRRKTFRFEVCPSCGKYLTKRSGKYGEFMGCTGYPNCHFTKGVSS